MMADDRNSGPGQRHGRQILLAVAILVGLIALGTFSVRLTGNSSALTQVLMAATGAAFVWFVIELIRLAVRAIRRPD